MEQLEPGIEFWLFPLLQVLYFAALAIGGIYLYILVVKYLRLKIKELKNKTKGD